MKHIYAYALAAIFILFGHTTLAQKITSKYVTEAGREVPAEQATYLVVNKEDSLGGGTSTRFYIQTNAKAREITYSDFNGGEHGQGIMNGPYTEWYPNGQLKLEATYEDDNLSGARTSWYENGQVHVSRKYHRNQPVDTLRTYYKSGALRRVEVYRYGKMASAKVFTESGAEQLYSPMEVMPEFPGGENAMLRWLSMNVRYPKATRKAKAEGMVVLSFVVDEQGKISQLEMVKGFHPAADAEAKRVALAMPVWQPGRLESQPVPVRYTLPIRFSIQ